MVSFLAFKAIGVAAAMALGINPPPPGSPPPDGMAQLPSDNGGSDQPQPGPGPEPDPDILTDGPLDDDPAGLFTGPDFPPPETWVQRAFEGYTFKTPDNPADILREADYLEFVLWEPDDSHYIILGAALNPDSYADLLQQLNSDGFDVTELGLVEIGAQTFHEIRVRDPQAELPYLDRAYYAAEPNADGLYLEFYGFASLRGAEAYDPLLLDFLASVEPADASAAAETSADESPDGGPGVTESTDSDRVTAYSMGGVTIDVPADWPVIQSGDDELAVGVMDESDGPPKGFAAGFMLDDDSLEEFIADAAKGGITIVEGETVMIGNQMFRAFEAEMQMGPANGHMKGLVSSVPNTDGQHVAVMTTVMGEPWEDYADTLEQVLASTRLAEDASFGPQPMDQSDSATPDPADAAAPPALIAHVVLGGTAEDRVSGRTLETSSTAPAPGRDGTPGAAMAFDGSAWVRLDQDINPATRPQVTLAAWVKPADGAPIQTIVSHDDGGFDRSLVIDRRGDGVGWSAFMGKGVLGAVPLTPGEWTFIAGVWDQTAETVRLHVDDAVLEQDGVATGSGHPFIHIGHNPSHGEGFRGSVQEVWVFDGALSPQAIQSLRAEGPTRTGPTTTEAAPDPAELAAQALERGQALQAEGDYVGALKAYRESLLLQPNDALLTRVETLERYLEVKGIDVPRQD